MRTTVRGNRDAYLRRAIDRAAEAVEERYAEESREAGHDCGHLFTVSASSVGHFTSADGGEHRDANWEGAPFVVRVRAHNQRDALIRAAAVPLAEWDRGPGITADEPPAERRSGMWRFIWWHRIHGHKVQVGMNLLGGSTPYRCAECGVVWERWWV